MCGIGGLLNFDGAKAPESVLRGMNALLRHRGPDDDGTYRDGPLGLAHTRLSILDTSDAGHQPMAFGDGRYWGVFNGEIYNFIEIRERLRGLGHRFRTETDTEVALAAYAEWGEDCLLEFNGMWGLAIWDRTEQSLFLSRDRFGVKPLFYRATKNQFAFASEMKGFLALPDFEPEFDPRSVVTSIRYPLQFESIEPALLAGARRLLPGRSMTVDRSGRIEIKRWWCTLDHLVDIPPTEERQVARFRELFEDACGVRARSDVPLATTLSGGLDSSSVHATLAHLYNTGRVPQRSARDKPTAFVGIVKGMEAETEAAKRVVSETNSKGFFTPLASDVAIDRVRDIVYAAEEISYLALGQWANYRTLRERGFKVSLDGHGSDEQTGGYREFPIPAIMDHVAGMRGIAGAAEGMGGLKLPRPIAEGLAKFPKVETDIDLERYYWRNPIDAFATAEPYPLASDSWRRDDEAMRTFSVTQRLMYYEFHEGRQPWILREFDRASMAHGIEVRSPFLDWRLVTYSFSLPTDIKIKNGYAKYILRRAMAGIVPDDIRRRKIKVGFPFVILGLTRGGLRPAVEEALNSEALHACAGIDGDAAKEAGLSDISGTARTAWLLANAAMLRDEFKSRRADAKAAADQTPK